MASYQYQPNPAYFEVPTFQAPDDFLFQISRQKQLMFDQGVNAVRSKYQSMATLPVSSQFGQAKRDAYMKDASEKLRKIAGADFSLQENQIVANSIYKPLTSDKDILYDLSQSRKAQKENQRMDMLENSKDEKERAQYWDTGRQYVNKSVLDLQSAKTADELHKVQVRDFVPYVDIIGKLNDAAKKLDLKVSIDNLGGGYIITKTNGEKANIPFYMFAQSQLGAQEREVLRVIGTVDADKSIAMETVRNGGNEQLARQSLAKDALDKEFHSYLDIVDDNTKHVADLKSKREQLIKNNGNQITDAIIGQLAQIDTQTEAIENSNQAIGKNLRDLGYTNIQGQYVPNENYQKTLNYYNQDLSIPYSRTAAKNMATNWAAGYAAATTGLKYTPDTNWQKGLDLQMEELKLKGKVAEAGAAAAAKGEKETKAPPIDYTNEPIVEGINPYGQQAQKTYDYFKAQEKSYQNTTFSRGIDLIQDSGVGLSADFLTAIATNLQNGAANESIIGNSVYSIKDNPKFKADIEKIKQMSQNGELTGHPGEDDAFRYSDLFKALLKRAQSLTKDKLNNPPTNEVDRQALSRLTTLSKEVEQNLNAYTVFKNDEKNIQAKVLQKKEYQDFVGTDGFKSKEQWLKEKTGYGSLEEFDKSPAGTPTVYAGEYYMSDSNARDRSFIKYLGTQYDSSREKFNKDFADFIGSGQATFLQKLPGSNGQVGFDYPDIEWRLSKNDEKTNKAEIGDLALREAFSESNIRGAAKVVNVADLGSADDVEQALKYIRDEIGGDANDRTGRVITSQVGSDGKSPVVKFFPTQDFIKDLVTKKSVYPAAADVLAKIGQHGIEIAATIPEVEKNKPSLVGRLIDANGEFNILPELKEKGFYAKVEKGTNERGYKVYLTYKTIDPSGKEVTVENQEQPDLFPEGRLDNLSQGLINDILAQYFKYSDQKNLQKQAAAPNQKVYTEAEYKLLLKNYAR